MNEKYILSTLNEFNIPEIPKEINFWMIRTKKGYFYDEFVENKFVALGWNAINKNTDVSKSSQETLKEYLSNTYGEKRPKLAINKCNNFINEIKEGDILLIPNKGTRKITFAIAGEYYEECFSEKDELSIIEKINNSDVQVYSVECPYNKRRRIKILKTVYTKNINIHLYMALTNYHGLSNLADYAKNILDSVYPIYIYNNICSLQVGINNQDEIDAHSLSMLTAGIIDCLQLITGEKKICTTMNLNSPGKISWWITDKKQQDNIERKAFDFLKKGSSKVILLAIIIGITGGEIKAGNVEISLPGIAKVIEDIKTIDSTVKKKEIEVEQLEIENFNDKYDIYKKIKNDNIDVDTFQKDLNKIIEAGKELNLGFDKLNNN